MRRRRWLYLLLLPAIGGVAFAAWNGPARGHMREVAARGEGDSSGCTMCHGLKGPPGGGVMHAHPAPWALAASRDGGELFVAATGTSQIARLGVSRARLERVMQPGGVVRGLDLAPDGGQLAASLSDVDQVALLDPDTGAVRATLRTGRSPAGVAFDAAGERLFVANMASHDLSIIDVATGVERRRVPAGREPFVVRLAPDGRTVAVVSRRMELTRPEKLPFSIVTLLDAATGLVRRVVRLDSCHMAEGAAFTRDGEHLLVPAILVRNRLPILQVERGWVMSSVVAVVTVATGDVRLLPLTEPCCGFPDPSGIALSHDGRQAFVAAGGCDQVAVLDVPALLAAAGEADAGQIMRLSQARRYVLRRIEVGSNPRAVLVVGGTARPRVAVAERLGDSVALIDPATRALDRVVLAPPVTDDPVHSGARNFHSARFAFQQAFSCRSCHPDGHTDGLTYDFDIDGVGRNVVLNRSLRGVAGTAPFKWIGLNPTLRRQCGPRFAMVLTRADPMNQDELGHVVAFLHSLRAPPADPHAGTVSGERTGAIARGKEFFERATRKDGTPIASAARCITCHPPPRFTSRQLADVGTKGPRDKTGLFDVPHLTGIGSKAPYLHDGRALTLEEIWTAPNVGDRHGVVSDLTKSELNDLVEYMKGL